MTFTKAPSGLLTSVLFGTTLVLSACGGGGGSSGAAPAPVSTDLVLTGTAATGAAISGGAVEAKCATGSGSTTSATDGSYTITISGGVLPCVVRVTAGATVLHSLATGTGHSARANLTPVSELTVARFAAVSPPTYYAAFDATAAAALTDAGAQAAASAAIDTLKPSGIDFSGGANVLNGALVAANGTALGDAYDQRLDALKLKLTASGVTLAQLAQAVALATPGAAAGTLSTTASLPPELLLAPQAPNCASLRSGKYRVVVNADGGAAPLTGLITVNAPALTFVDTLGATETLTVTGPCTYTNEDGGEVIVNKAGVIVSRVLATGGTLQGAVLFPEQSHTVAELAGDYNAIAFDRTTSGGAIHLTSSTATVDAGGKLTALNFCDDLRICVVTPSASLPNLTFTTNVAGGFTVTNTTAGYVDRAFAYRAGGGHLMVVELAAPGHITFSTRNVAVVMPPVGRVQQFWNLFMGSTYTAPAAISLSKNTVDSVDNAAGTFNRTAVLDFATGVTRPETLQINSLRSGYNHRLGPVTVMTSNGSFSTTAEFISLTMRGMDLSVLALPGSNQLGLSSLDFSIP